jgi:AcrR family transcriptional regulator
MDYSRSRDRMSLLDLAESVGHQDMDGKSETKSTTRRQRVPVSPCTSRGQRTRQRLMEAAIEIIGAQGIAPARVSDITRRAGCGYGTFYKYFRSKIDLMRQAMTEVLTEMHEESLPPMTSGSSPEERMRLGITRYTDAVVRRWPAFKALGRAAGLDPELLILRDVLLHRDVEELARRISLMEKAGYGQVADPYLVSLALNSMADEMSRRWIIYGDQISKEDFIELLVSMFEMTLLGRRTERAPGGPANPLVMTPDG